eukprot:1042517-Amorphochlora_amoeboformis.AAC.1
MEWCVDLNRARDVFPFKERNPERNLRNASRMSGLHITRWQSIIGHLHLHGQARVDGLPLPVLVGVDGLLELCDDPIVACCEVIGVKHGRYQPSCLSHQGDI